MSAVSKVTSRGKKKQMEEQAEPFDDMFVCPPFHEVQFDKDDNDDEEEEADEESVDTQTDT